MFKKIALPVLLVLILLMICLGAAAAWDYNYYQYRVYPGVYLDGLDLGGQGREEVYRLIRSRGYQEIPVNISYPGVIEVTLSLGELGYRLEEDAMTQEAFQVGRQGTYWENLLERYRVYQEGVDIPLAYHFDQEKVRFFYGFIARDFPTETVDARLVVQGDDISLEPSVTALRLELEESLELFLRQVSQLDRLGGTLDLPVLIQEELPAVTTEELEAYGLKKLMVKFSTEFSLEEVNRNINIQLASQYIDDYLMAPGDIFSFNKVVGKTTAEKGYREAPVIYAGEFVPGLGGGICQVSSTLYNAALMADLEIVERLNHGRPVSYLPLGRDATIAYGYIDLKFRNDRHHHLLITTEVTPGTLLVRIFGDKDPEKRIEIMTRDTVVIPPPERLEEVDYLPPGEKKLVEAGSQGYRVSVYRVTYRGDREIKRERVSRDLYRARPFIYHVGKEEPPPDPHPGPAPPAGDAPAGDADTQARDTQARDDTQAGDGS